MANTALTILKPVAMATQAEQETGTSVGVYVSPGRQKYHESSAKAWLQQSMSGTSPVVDASYNVISVIDGGVGDFTAVFFNIFSSANYCFTSCNTTTGSVFVGVRENVLIAGSARYVTLGTASPYSNLDPVKSFGIQCFGDQ